MSAGKGDAPRNCFSETYRENYDNIFRKKNTDREEFLSVLDSDKNNKIGKKTTNSKDYWKVWPAVQPSSKPKLSSYTQVFRKKPLDGATNNSNKYEQEKQKYGKDKTNHRGIRGPAS